MKFVEPSVEYWPQAPGLSGMWSQIARATRLCYDSKPRDGETDKEFVERVILKPARKADGSYDFERLHGGMLEMGTVYLELSEEEYLEWGFNLDDGQDYKHPMIHSDFRKGNCYVTTNMRYILENGMIPYYHDWLVDSPTKYHYQRYCFHVITDIGVSREWNRHRASMSIAEQSTRFVDYTKDKHGGELTFIRPQWVREEEIKLAYKVAKEGASSDKEYAEAAKAGAWLAALQECESSYQTLRRRGWRPEQARQVLPLNTKTEVAYCAYEDSWRHFIKLRGSKCVSGKAHPNIMPLADEIERKLNKLTGK